MSEPIDDVIGKKVLLSFFVVCGNRCHDAAPLLHLGVVVRLVLRRSKQPSFASALQSS